MIKAEISGVTILRGYSMREKEMIINDCTLPNPAYESMKRFAGRKARYSKISKTLDYYRNEMGAMIVPRGYMPPVPVTIAADRRTTNTVTYPKLHIKLRGTQIEAVKAYLEKLENDVHQPHGIIVLPTGKGKSILGLYLARKTSQRALIVVHKDDLVTGWIKDAKLVFGLRQKQVGVIKAGQFNIGEQLTVATVQTLAKMDRVQMNFLRKQFGMIIVDEFHHSAAKIYEIVANFPAKYRLGLTATPSRNDGLTDALHLYFGKVAYEYKDVGGDEDIMPVTVKIRNVTIRPEIKTEEYWETDEETGEKVKKNKPIRIHDVRANTLYNQEYLYQLCTDIITEYENNKSCIVFTHERDHIDIIEQALIERGIPSNRVQQYVGGSSSKSAKDAALKRAETKKVLVTIATFHIATEGTNVKAWERGFLASSIANANDTIQAIGRIRRIKAGKKDAVVYDYRFPYTEKANKHGKVRDAVYLERNFNVLGEELKASKRRDKKKRKTGRGFAVFQSSRV